MKPSKKLPADKIPWIVLAVFTLYVLSAFRPAKPVNGFDVNGFGAIPVLLNGRLQPLDSVARNTLLTIREKKSVRLPEGSEKKELSATEWLLEVMCKPEVADERPLFRIVNPEIIGQLNLSEERKHFSFKELIPQFETIEKEANRIREIDAQVRSPFEKQMARLHFALGQYHRLKNSLRPEGADEFESEVQMYETSMGPGLQALKNHEAGKSYPPEDLDVFVRFFQRYQMVSQIALPLIVPPMDPQANPDDWKNIGTSLMDSMKSASLNPALPFLARMADGFRHDDASKFNTAVKQYQAHLEGQGLRKAVSKASNENFFNRYSPFTKSMAIYVFALILALVFWLNSQAWAWRSAYLILCLAWVIHTSGLIFRMVLEGRPPVTNLYSSAVFVGWGAVILGIILERIYRDGIGVVVASMVGFTTLIIAHHLSLSGDTMEMLRAVLDTNIWLATHVVVITLGYSSMFVAGVLAMVYVIRGFFTRGLEGNTAKSLARMVYGIICFSTLFSFVGTILGGIWADQSWGRFWGWDPKENGALLIVLWCAIILHARWGGMIRERGLMNMAIFGNVVTAFSWFGVNMLGVGLHSYGFMDSAFKWLMLFVLSQMLLIACGCVPLRHWASFRGLSGTVKTA